MWISNEIQQSQGPTGIICVAIWDCSRLSRSWQWRDQVSVADPVFWLPMWWANDTYTASYKDPTHQEDNGYTKCQCLVFFHGMKSHHPQTLTSILKRLVSSSQWITLIMPIGCPCMWEASCRYMWSVHLHIQSYSMAMSYKTKLQMYSVPLATNKCMSSWTLCLTREQIAVAFHSYFLYNSKCI